MQDALSILGNKILYDPKTKSQDIADILAVRYGDLGDLEKSLDDLYDPYLLADMDKAVARIKEAKEKGERVVVFWDYDVDGATSTSILIHFFKTVGIECSYRLPDRVKDGYGLKNYFIDELHEKDVKLIITVDCGTRDVECVKHAKSLWIDVIITDHHAVPDQIPEEAVALINPKRKDCAYPFKWLAGAGVAYKLMMALAREYMDDEQYSNYLRESIDIAAIGTVADCMQLTGENRIIVIEWLKQIKNTRSRGIKELISHKMEENLDADIFGFLIGPRLNAAGRMWSPYKAVNLILNQWDGLEQTLAEIEAMNTDRKALTTSFVDDALLNINPKDNLIFYDSTDVTHGIIGIVAGRLTEKYYKPSIVLVRHDDKLIASCRSPDYFDMITTLGKYKEYFLSFGWHKQAAWFSISVDKFDEFKEKILEELNALPFDQYKREIKIDKMVELDELWFKFLEKVNVYKPFGMGNTKPLFIVEDFQFKAVRYLWKWLDHIRFDTKQGFKVFGFFMWEHMDDIKKADKIDLIFDIAEDLWNGRRNLMLKIVDIVIH